MGSEQDVVTLLAKGELFGKLDVRSLKRLAGLCVSRDYKAGETIMKEGGTGLGMLLIVEGQVDVFKTVDDRETHIATLGAGEVLGEMSLIDEEPRSASGKAVTDCKTLLLTRDSFRKLVTKETAIAWSLVPVLVSRLRKVQDEQFHAQQAAAAPIAEPAPPVEGSVSGGDPSEPQAETNQDDDESDSPSGADEKSAISAYLGTVGWRLPFTAFLGGATVMEEMMHTFGVGLQELSKSSGLAYGEKPSQLFLNMPQAMIDASQAALNRSKEIPGNTIDRMEEMMRAGEEGEQEDELDETLGATDPSAEPEPLGASA